MRLASAILILAAAGIVADDDPKKKDDAALIKGKWSAVSLSFGGKPAPEDFAKDFKFTLDDKTYTNIVNGKVIEEGEYKIDDSKSPKTIDFDIKKGDDSGKKQLGIYKIEGEKLTIIVAQAGSDERPKSFKVEGESPFAEVVLEKVKP
jgi:uncharacterized protein (TIGR03067 family)